MSGVIASSKAAADHPATVTIKTSDAGPSRNPHHMLAEHNLQRAPCFRRTRGHIPSLRCSYRCHLLRSALTRANLHSLSGCFCQSQSTFSARLTAHPTKEWWRRTGSNRRPDACKATALPAELRPLIMVGLGRLERPTSPLSGVRSNHLSYRPRMIRHIPLNGVPITLSGMRKRNEDGAVPPIGF